MERVLKVRKALKEKILRFETALNRIKRIVSEELQATNANQRARYDGE